MTIYAIEGGKYSDRYLEGYCTTEENALQVIARLNSEHNTYDEFRMIEIECLDNLASAKKKIRYAFSFVCDIYGHDLWGEKEGVPTIAEHKVEHKVNFQKKKYLCEHGHRRERPVARREHQGRRNPGGIQVRPDFPLRRTRREPRAPHYRWRQEPGSGSGQGQAAYALPGLPAPQLFRSSQGT